VTEAVLDRSLTDAIRRWREHPASMVRELFGVEPDPWQVEVLESFPHSPRLAMKACKGPGKTTTLAWLCWNFLLTRPHPKIAATSISGDNLSDGLWTEMAKWQNKSILLLQTFTWTKSRIFANDHPQTWWMAARTWSKSADKDQQANTLAGLHADYILFVLDESGGIPDAVMAAAEAALSTGIEMHIVQAGNPTHLEGPLWRACTIEARLWKVVTITGDPDDPQRSPRISIQWAREQIEKWGRQNPWVLVNVFGQFPPSSINALIGPDDIEAAFKRTYTDFQIGRRAMILGVDVARFGSAASVIFPRRGIQAFNPTKLRGVNSVQGAGTVARIWDDMQAQACFVDDTGGFGSGWIDQLEALGRTPIGIHFAGEANQNRRYANKRTEMYFESTDWIKNGGALPNVPELKAALPVTTYTFTKSGLMILEPKEMIEAKIGYSPDDADAFALTFAQPVAYVDQPLIPRRQGEPNMTRHEWQPFGGSSIASAVDSSYDPFRR
jgi:phage terminase large subunit